MSIAAFGVKRPVIANLVMFAIIGAGLVFGVGLRREFFPEIRPETVTITAPYPGASPDEVESSLARKIEDRVADLDDVKEVNTTIREGMCSINVEFETDVDITKVVFDVQSEMDALQDLPPEVERITTAQFDPAFPTINVSIFGDADERTMKRAILDLRDDLRTLPGMGRVSASGYRTNEISVEVSPAVLIEHKLSLPAIADRIRQAMTELPAGSVKSSTANIAVRTIGAEENASQIRDIVVKAGSGGQVIRVGDIATVTPGFADTDLRVRLNGKPAVSLTVFKIGDQDAVSMAEMVKAYVAGRTGKEFEPTWGERFKLLTAHDKSQPASPRMQAFMLGASKPPAPGELAITTDLARFIVGRLDLLTRNAMWGGFLVLITLVVLLNARVAFWVAIGLVVSLLATLAAMHFLGLSLNLLSMFGLIIVLGLLVDDAIVVAENITARHEQGESARDAAINGTNIVAWPVVATVLTTICAFFPLSLVEGRIGDLIQVLPYVVTVALAVSLIEALFILPSHMAHSLKANDSREGERAGWLSHIEARFDTARDALFQKFITRIYSRVLPFAIRNRYPTFAFAIALIIISAGMVAGGRVAFNLFPSSDSETINVALTMPVGTPIDETDRIVKKIERISMAQPEVSATWAIAGQYSSLEGDSNSEQSHVGQLVLELVPVEQRDRSSGQIIEAIREDIGELPTVKSLRIAEIAGGPEGPAINLTVVGPSAETIMASVNDMKAALAKFPAVRDIADDNDTGKRELRFALRPGADELGFTPESIARQVRAAVFGLEAHTFAGVQEDVDVRVTIPREDRRSIATLESLFVFTPDATPIPIAEVVEITEAPSYASITKLDRKRAISVQADVIESIANAEQIMEEFQPELDKILAAHPGVEIIARGRQKDFADSFRTLPIGMLAACGLIYVVLTWLFQSYTQPLVVLLAVPFSFIGMVWGHLALGFDLTFLSLIGFIALAGVVVNDSLIYVEFFNHKRTEGLAIREAAIEAGLARIRPILLTTITTVLGLTPLMLEQSFQARFLIPMAITISGGLISATFIILIVLPCILLIGQDIRYALLYFWHAGDIPEPDPAPDTP